MAKKSSFEESDVGRAFAEEWNLALNGQIYVLEERAAEQAKREVQKMWLPRLQERLAEMICELKNEPDSETRVALSLRAARVALEIKRLRQALKLGPDVERRRQMTRERVARWRQQRREQRA